MSPKRDHASGLFSGIATGSAAPLGIQAGGTDTGWVHWQDRGGRWQGLLRSSKKGLGGAVQET